ANFLLAQTDDTTTNTEITIEITVADSGNRKDFQAISSMPLESIMFYFDDLNDSANSIQISGTPLTTDLMNWTLNLSDGYLINTADYNFYAIGFYEGVSYPSINYILIQADNEDITPEITVQVENNQTILQGAKYFYAYINTGHSLNNLTFYFDDLNTSIIDDYNFGIGSEVSADLSSWSTIIDTINMPNGEYKFYAKGLYENISYNSQNHIYVTIENNAGDTTTNNTDDSTDTTVSSTDDTNISTTTENELRIEFTTIPSSPIYGDNTISAVTNIEPDSVEFKVTGPQDSTFPGVMDSLTSYHFIWDTVSFPDGYYYVETIAKKGTLEAYAYFNINVENTYDDNITSDDNTTDDTTTSDNITDSLIISFIERFESPFSGDQQISISSNQEIFSCVFKIYGPKYAEFPAIKDSPNNCHIILHTKDFPDGYYTIKAVAGNNIGTAEIRLDAEIKNQIAIEPDQPPITEPAPT
ncbi:MAG: hypothetical protein KAS78_04425, partial [Candidatus Pacebacteria bacterium]|nr:hypothetical protein [Candidatus Paceibacterota bacterium]